MNHERRSESHAARRSRLSAHAATAESSASSTSALAHGVLAIEREKPQSTSPDQPGLGRGDDEDFVDLYRAAAHGRIFVDVTRVVPGVFDVVRAHVADGVAHLLRAGQDD